MDHHPHTEKTAPPTVDRAVRPSGRRSCGRRARLAVAALAALGVLGGLGQPAHASEAAGSTDAADVAEATDAADATVNAEQAAEEAQAAEGAQATPIPPVARPASLLHELDGIPLDKVTLAGSHNTYQKRGCNPLDARCSAEEQSRTFHYLYDGFASAQAIEIDVFTTFGWKVNHDLPGSNSNNCPEAGVNGNTRNQDLRSCIEGLRTWHEANPDHPLQIVKLELKDGFRSGRSPAELDELIANLSGRGSKTRIPRNWIFTPDDLRCATGTCFATPDEAARAGAWPTMGQLRGKFMFVIINGVSDSTMAQVGAAVFGVQDGSVQYARALAAGQAHLVFPSMLLKSPANGDVRPGRYPTADAFDASPFGSIHVVCNRMPRDRFVRAEIERELLAVTKSSIAGLWFVPHDRKIPVAAWNGELVGRSRAARALDPLINHLAAGPTSPDAPDRPDPDVDGRSELVGA